MRELPALQNLSNAFRGRGLELVTVMVDGHPTVGRRVVDRLGLTAPVVVGDHELMALFRANAYPWTVIVDREGKARMALRGARERSELKRAFEEYL